jgi:HEAT repeat protein/Tfp pilus assembly protein FimT
MRGLRLLTIAVVGVVLLSALPLLSQSREKPKPWREWEPLSEDKAADVEQAEHTLAAAGIANDGPALLEFFLQRARLDMDPGKLAALTRQLTDPAAEVRARAAAALVARGPTAIPVLRQACNNLDDRELTARARRCLELIEGPSGAAVTTAAARLISERNPPGAARALLAYLPYADDGLVLEQVGKALATLAFPEGKADPDLVLALKDSLPVRRAVAAEALCRKDHPELYPAVRKLLQDARPSVRMKAALTLAREYDPEAVPVLIDLLADMAPAERKPIEEILQELAGEWTPGLNLAGDDDISRRIRRDVWAGWWKRTDGPALLTEFRKRTLSAADLAKIQDLIEKLGDDSFRTREQAVADLVAFGSPAVPMLREAVKSTALERRLRAIRCLNTIAKSENRNLPLAAARLLALRKPEGAADALLAVLPWIEDENLVAEIQTALGTLARRDPKAVTALVRTLDEKLAIRRTAAGIALASAADAKHRRAAHKLLQDPQPDVRLRVALALAAAMDKEAVPVLIDLLTELTREHFEPAHEALLQIAGEKAPQTSLGDDKESRKKNRDAWAAWWEANSAKADLGKLTAATTATLGYTLISQNILNQTMGRVVELGRDGKPRWQIDNLAWPIDARMLSNNRVFILEWDARRITERDLKGTVLWTYQTGDYPINAQRLRNGHTFVATQSEVVELDRDKKEIYRHNFQNKGQSLNAAFRLANGEILCFTRNGVAVRIDAKGKQVKSFPFQAPGRVGGVDVNAAGKIIMVASNQTVHALDMDGKQIFQVSMPNPTTASWLPNGNILVASYESNRAVEFNPQGRVVWEQRDNYHFYRARRR